MSAHVTDYDASRKPEQAATRQVVAARRPPQAAAPRPAWLDHRLYPFESRYLMLEGHRIHYIDEGTGPVLLFLHAVPLWSFQYRVMIKGLRDRFRCIALDYPGFGLSTAAPGYHGTLRDASRLVEGFIRALGLSAITLVGHDSSCAIGLGVVGRSPHLFKALVLSNGFAWPLEAYPGIYRALQVAGSRPAGFLVVHANILLRLTLKIVAGGKLTRAERASYSGPFAERGQRHHQHDMFRTLTRSGDYLRDLEDKLRAVGDLPALLLFSDDDSTYKAGFMTRYERQFTRHRSVLIAGGGHILQEHAPGRMAMAIRDWWDTAASQG
jgi:haloalkane dehalogenase